MSGPGQDIGIHYWNNNKNKIYSTFLSHITHLFRHGPLASKGKKKQPWFSTSTDCYQDCLLLVEHLKATVKRPLAMKTFRPHHNAAQTSIIYFSFHSEETQFP